MRRATLAALGVALTVGAGTAPALAASPAPDHDAVVDALTSSARAVDAARGGQPRARSLADSPTALPVDDYYRLAGANRYATAVEVSKAMVCAPTTATVDCQNEGQVIGGVDQPVTTVFVANGLDYPDALGAGPLASGLGPLLLVPPTGTLPAVVKTEINRIKPTDIVIFGGTGAVSSSMENQLKTLATTHRIAGANRYETAAAATMTNDAIWRDQDGDDADDQPDEHGLDTVVLASGAGFADALAGGGAAANTRGSLMLVAKAALPAVTKDALQEIAAGPRDPALPKIRVIILGGTGVVSASVESAVNAAVPGATVERAAGSDRFGTAIAMSKKVFPAGAPEVFVVNGFNFPDALASAPLAGLWGASTLLGKTTCVTAGTRAEASRLDPQFVTGFGGTGVLSDAAVFLDAC